MAEAQQRSATAPRDPCRVIVSKLIEQSAFDAAEAERSHPRKTNRDNLHFRFKVVFDTIDTWTSQYDPVVMTASTCSGVPPTSASWTLSNGVLAIRPDGAVAFADVASILRTCPGSTYVDYQPGYGRMVYLP